MQRTSSDLKVNPHIHVVFLDGVYRETEDGGELAWSALGHLGTSEVGDVLERAVRRMDKHLRRRGLIATEVGGDEDPEAALIASAVSGDSPPAGPQWRRGLVPLAPSGLRFDKPLCAALDGFTLDAATHAGALDVTGREALLRYVLRPPLATERVDARPDGLVRLAFKRPSRTGPSRSTWIRSRFSVASRPACLHRAFTP